MCAQSLSHVRLFEAPWTVAHQLQLLCPWNFPGENTGVGFYCLLLGVFLTQGSNPCLLLWQADSLPRVSARKPHSVWYYSDKHVSLYIYQKPIECVAPRFNCKVNDGFSGTMICQWMFINFNHYCCYLKGMFSFIIQHDWVLYACMRAIDFYMLIFYLIIDIF